MTPCRRCGAPFAAAICPACGATRVPRRWPFALAAILILLAGTGYGAIRYQTAPERTLEKLGPALLAGDWAGAEPFLDPAAIAASLAEEIVTDRLALLGTDANAEEISAAGEMRRVLALRLRSLLEDAVREDALGHLREQGEQTPDEPSIWNVPENTTLLERAELGIARAAGGQVRDRTDTGIVYGLHLHYPELDTTLVLDLAMRRSERSWRVTAVKDFLRFAGSVAAVKDMRLEAANRRTLGDVAGWIHVGQAEGRYREEHLGLGMRLRTARLWVSVENRGTEPLEDLRLRATLQSGETVVLSAPGILLPGESGMAEYEDLYLESSDIHALVRADRADEIPVRLFAATRGLPSGTREVRSGHATYADLRASAPTDKASPAETEVSASAVATPAARHASIDVVPLPAAEPTMAVETTVVRDIGWPERYVGTQHNSVSLPYGLTVDEEVVLGAVGNKEYGAVIVTDPTQQRAAWLQRYAGDDARGWATWEVVRTLNLPIQLESGTRPVITGCQWRPDPAAAVVAIVGYGGRAVQSAWRIDPHNTSFVPLPSADVVCALP